MPFTISPDNRQSVASPGARGGPWEESAGEPLEGDQLVRGAGGPWEESAGGPLEGDQQVRGAGDPWKERAMDPLDERTGACRVRHRREGI